MKHLVIILLFCANLELFDAQCVDEKGAYVDWVAMYKLPKNSEVHENKRKAKNYIDEGMSLFDKLSKPNIKPIFLFQVLAMLTC